jgi:hypothetical protein
VFITIYYGGENCVSHESFINLFLPPPCMLLSLDEYKKVRPCFFGDFYPLTDFTKSLNEWMVYQFHRIDLKEGMVLFFRRPFNDQIDQNVGLKGLDEKATFELLFEDIGVVVNKTGKELMVTGVSVRILERRESLLTTYKKSE